MTWALLSLVLATPNFPPELQRLSGAAGVPDCAVCHQGTPMVGTAVTAFGTTLREAGLKANDVASLEAAWQQLGEHDSNGDGVSDKQALAQGDDPNGGGFSYGCAAVPSTGSTVALLWLCGAILRQRSRVIGRLFRGIHEGKAAPHLKPGR